METARTDSSHVTTASAPQAGGTVSPAGDGGFEIDVFISYAHIDNQPLVPGEEGWVNNLHHALSARLPQLVGGPVNIWRDAKLEGNDLLFESLEERLARTAVMLSIVSPRYVASDSCRHEMETFERCCAGSVVAAPASKSRLFKVIKTPVPLDEQPAHMQKLLGYEFFAVDPHSQRPRELRQDTGPNKDQRYWDRLEDLAYEVAETVMAMRDAGPAAAPVADGAAPVYLAATSSDLSDEYDLVRRELMQRGHPVLPDQPLPTVASDLQEAVSGYLSRSALAVHLIGNRYGLVPEGTMHSMSELQNEVAAMHAKSSGCRRVIWLPRELEPEDERQRRFTELLETDADAQANADVLRTDLGELKRVVLGMLETRADEGSGEPVAKDVYLLYAPEDFDAAAQLEDALFEAGCEILTPLIDAEGQEDPEEHQANLADCEAILVFQGDAPERWLRERLRELEQVPEQMPRTIFLGAPSTPRKERLRTHRATVIKQFGDFEHGHLAPFLDELRSEGAGA